MRGWMHRYSNEQVAEVCHRAITGLQEVCRQSAAGTPSSGGEFADLTPDLREIAVEGVRNVRMGAIPSPRHHHSWWAETLRSLGWKRGPRNPGGKTHPSLVDWSQLPPEQQDEDRLFIAVVTALTVE